MCDLSKSLLITQITFLRQRFDDLFNLFNVFVANAFAAAVAAFEPVEDEFPDFSGRLKAGPPLRAAERLPFEGPFPRESFGAEKAASLPFPVLYQSI